MSRFKKLTHWVAGAFIAVMGFAVSPAGQAIVVQYPKLSGVVTLLSLLGALYHQPEKTPVLAQ